MIPILQNMNSEQIREHLWVYGDNYSVEQLKEQIEEERSKKKWRLNAIKYLDRAIRIKQNCKRFKNSYEPTITAADKG